MLVAKLSGCALFLDFDGTLVDIAPFPSRVRVPSNLVPLLDRLTSGLGGALAILTGRPIIDINRFLLPLQPVTAGVHGSELRTEANGEVLLTVDGLNPDVAASVGRLQQLDPGVVIESKVYSIAVHYRLAPAVEPQIKTALRAIVTESPDHFILCPGRCVIEVVPRHVSKGAALEAMMHLPAFKGRCPIMIGDDIPDESALAAARKLGGYGLRVGGEHFRADAEFEGPAKVRAWLTEGAEILEADAQGGVSLKPQHVR
jgi:trehalose 6-phosphate phosphatase